MQDNQIPADYDTLKEKYVGLLKKAAFMDEIMNACKEQGKQLQWFMEQYRKLVEVTDPQVLHDVVRGGSDGSPA